MAGIARTLLAAGSALIATAALAGTAQAGCGGTVCTGHVTSTSTLPPLSSYFEHEAKLSTYCRTSSCGQTVSHAPSPTYAPTTSYAPVQSYTAPQHYAGTPAYTAQSLSYAPLTSTTVSGLGAREGLRPTRCPVAVDTSDGSKVLGCYNVVRKAVRPVTRTTYYRVVRPIIYVRYPVPVPVAVPVYGPTCGVPVCHTGHAHHGRSRYGY